MEEARELRVGSGESLPQVTEGQNEGCFGKGGRFGGYFEKDSRLGCFLSETVSVYLDGLGRSDSDG